MAKEVNIFTFINDREGREEGERQLSRMVNEGYEIITSGAGTGADLLWGIVILQRDNSKPKEDD